MKNIIALLITVITIISCGKDKSPQEGVKNEPAADKFTVEIEGLYEKDDSLAVVYQKGGYYVYEKPVSVKVTGSPTMQKVIFNIPEGEIVENLKITASTNKDQKFLTIKNISVRNNGQLLIDGDNGKHAVYFASDESFTWDEAASRYVLSHDKKYAPTMVGTETLADQLEQ